MIKNYKIVCDQVADPRFNGATVCITIGCDDITQAARFAYISCGYTSMSHAAFANGMTYEQLDAATRVTEVTLSQVVNEFHDNVDDEEQALLLIAVACDQLPWEIAESTRRWFIAERKKIRSGDRFEPIDASFVPSLMASVAGYNHASCK